MIWTSPSRCRFPGPSRLLSSTDFFFVTMMFLDFFFFFVTGDFDDAFGLHPHVAAFLVRVPSNWVRPIFFLTDDVDDFDFDLGWGRCCYVVGRTLTDDSTMIFPSARVRKSWCVFHVFWLRDEPRSQSRSTLALALGPRSHVQPFAHMDSLTFGFAFHQSGTRVPDFFFFLQGLAAQARRDNLACMHASRFRASPSPSARHRNPLRAVGLRPCRFPACSSIGLVQGARELRPHTSHLHPRAHSVTRSHTFTHHHYAVGPTLAPALAPSLAPAPARLAIAVKLAPAALTLAPSRTLSHTQSHIHAPTHSHTHAPTHAHTQKIKKN